jgi:hypothetical protein
MQKSLYIMSLDPSATIVVPLLVHLSVGAG